MYVDRQARLFGHGGVYKENSFPPYVYIYTGRLNLDPSSDFSTVEIEPRT